MAEEAKPEIKDEAKKPEVAEAKPAEVKTDEKATTETAVKPETKEEKSANDAPVRGVREEDPLEHWKPITKLGKDVFEGRITHIDQIFKSGKKILEPQIVDKLVPDIKQDLILVGGRGGKGGGAQRIPVRITAAMHKSGRRFHMGALMAVGNEDGVVGLGQGRATETRDAIKKAFEKGKLNLISVSRGCGSWECGCGTGHSIPYKTSGKSGSVFVELLPAPRGVGLVAENEAKKILKLAGIKDCWVKTRGNTGMRINLANALMNALKNLYIYEKGE